MNRTQAGKSLGWPIAEEADAGTTIDREDIRVVVANEEEEGFQADEHGFVSFGFVSAK